MALALRVGDQRSKRADFTIQLFWPVKPVGPSSRTSESLGILQNLVAITVLARIFPLRVHISPHHLKCSQFVLADPPPQKFIFSHLRIEEPSAILFHDRNWKRPQVVS